MREPPDRINAIQVPLYLGVIAAPALTFTLRRRGRRLQAWVFVLQLLVYGAYETGVAGVTDNRADLLFVFAAIGLNYWLAIGRAHPAAGPR
jgi:hypothetical protein